MPSSRPNHIPLIISAVRQIQPKSILDIGTGFGKWGVLFREYTDIIASEHNPERYQKPGWQVRIDGVEGFEPYVTDLHRFVYNNLYQGEALEILENCEKYDLIFIGDVIEHFEKPDGQEVLRRCLEKANKAVMISTPATETPQDGVCGNELETHRSHWTKGDFLHHEGWDTIIAPGDIRVALNLRGETPRFSLKKLSSSWPRWMINLRKRLGKVKRGLLND